jgi:MFS family permease
MEASEQSLPHRHTPGSARAAFSYRSYRIIWTGLFLSSIGTWMQNLALPAYIDHRTGSAQIVGILIFAQLGPLLVLAIPGSVVADRVNRRVFLLSMQWLQLVFSLVLAAIVAADGPIWSIFLAQLVIGTGNALNAPAFQASIPLLVDRRDLAGAISMNSIQLNGSRVLGPTLAAVLTLWGISTAGLFVINAVTYLFLIVAITMVTIPDVRGDHAEKGWRQFLTGIRISRERPVLSRLLVGMATFSLFSLVLVALFPSVTRLNFGVDSESSTFKAIYATWGLGAFTGAVLTGTLLTRFHRPTLIRWGFVGFGLSLAGFAIIRSPGPAFPVGFVLGSFYFMLATAMVTVFQENLRDTERVRVMPLWFMAFGGTVTIGGLIAGPIIDAIGARWVLLFGAAYAVFLARWCDVDRLPRQAFLRD